MKAKQAITALSALAHEHRLGVYRMLVEAGPAGMNAGTIATKMKIPPSSLTFHLQNLQRAGLITQGRHAQWRPCRLEAKPLREVADWVEQYRQFWEESLDRLEDYLRVLQAQEKVAQQEPKD